MINQLIIPTHHGRTADGCHDKLHAYVLAEIDIVLAVQASHEPGPRGEDLPLT
jgi:hypothetical protein